MEVTILGSGTCSPSPRRGCAGYLLETGGRTLLIDAGPGTYRQLARHCVDFASIDEIFITHMHVDHINDLPAILFSRKHCLGGAPKDELVIHGPTGFSKYFSLLLNAYGSQLEGIKIKINDHSDDEWKTGDITVKTLPMNHSLINLGYRFERFLDGREKSLVYSGDTSPCENIVTLARQTGCLLMEASAPDNAPVPGHTTTSQAAEIARKAEVRLLVLTHLSPENDTGGLEEQVSAIYRGNVIVAADGMKIRI